MMNNFTNAATLISGLTSAVLLLIAIYTFYLTFISKRITIPSVGFSFHHWESDSIVIVLKNKTLQAFTINEIHAVFDNKYRIKICKYDIPILLRPYNSIIVKMDPFTRMDGFHLSDFQKMEMAGKDIYFEIKTDEHKIIYSHFKGNKQRKYKIWDNSINVSLWREKHKDRDSLINVFILAIKLGDIVLRDDYAYILEYRTSEDHVIQTAFINDGGIISTCIFGFNAIPKEDLLDVKKIRNIFTVPCKELQIGLSIQNAKDLTGR
ncbi:MAG: hypothetical protein FWD70_01220 [Desulfuromonadales bacterium]|nr:hypothetical protein [Desulfuromonadales bacterium]